MTNKQYDILKVIALLVLPIGTFIATVLGIWGFAIAEPIQQTFIALDVLCGSIVSVAKVMWERKNEADKESKNE